MFTPVYISPLFASSAAPTAKPEYGQYAFFRTSSAASESFFMTSFVMSVHRLRGNRQRYLHHLRERLLSLFARGRFPLQRQVGYRRDGKRLLARARRRDRRRNARKAAAGVDVTAGYESTNLIKPMVESTYIPGVIGTLGGFGGCFELPGGYSEPVMVSGTDGVGTKLKLAYIMDRQPFLSQSP